MSLSEDSIHIVLVDDDEQHLTLLRRALEEESPSKARGSRFRIECFSDPTEALAAMPPEGPVVVLCDYNMPGSTGLDWLPDFLRLDRGPVIITTGQGDESIAAQAFRSRAADYVIKSQALDHPEMLQRAVREAWRRHRLERRNRELTRKLKLANEVLEAKNRKLRSMTETAHRFVDDVAHDLRTPLTVIGEFASIIEDGLDGPITEDQSEHLQLIQSATRELSRMVDDFLDSSKMRAGCLRVDRRPVEVAEIVESILPMLRARADAGGMTLLAECPSELPRVFADLEKAQRVLINLTQNAIKFSPTGSTVRLWARPDEGRGVEIGVSDEGPGMSADALRVIFDRFRQTDTAAASKSKGFGLGLSIVKELIALNLGVVDVVSEPGRGSRFSFTLPPCDPATIVEIVLDQIGREPVAVLEASPQDDDPEGLRSFLASVCYPRDVVLKAGDEPRVLLVGATSEPDRWTERLAEAARPGPDGTGYDGVLELRNVGRWWSAIDDRRQVLRAMGLEPAPVECAA